MRGVNKDNRRNEKKNNAQRKLCCGRPAEDVVLITTNTNTNDVERCSNFWIWRNHVLKVLT